MLVKNVRRVKKKPPKKVEPELWEYGVVMPNERCGRPRKGYHVDDNNCWIYDGAKDRDGYGVVNIHRPRKTTQTAHRFFYERWVGPVATGLELDHKCRVRACVNPEHLRLVTHAENMALAKANWKRKTHCRYWHRYTKRTTYTYTDGRRACRVCIAARGYARREGVEFRKGLTYMQRRYRTKQDIRALIDWTKAGRPTSRL